MLSRVIIGLAALALIAFCAGLVLFADEFPAPGEAAERRPILLYVFATVGVSLLHVMACLVAHRRPPRLRHVLLVGAATRLLLLFGAPAPILEGDADRMRFDARIVNQGLNPYEFKPMHMLDEEPSDVMMAGPQIERLTRARAAMTASNDAPRPDQVARPDLRTSATPLTVWVAAAGDQFKPQSTRGIAFLALVADSLAMFFIILSLRKLCLPVGWVIVYAWCPVLLKETYCTLSVDVFVLPAIALLVWCIASGRRMLAAVPLALCGGFRFALLALVPVFWRRIGILGVMLTAVLFLAPFLPFQTPDVPAQRYAEGNLHVWRHYEYNSMLENLLRNGFSSFSAEAENTLTIGGVAMVQPGDALHVFLAKIVGLLVLAAVVIYLVIRSGQSLEVGGSDETQGIVDLFTILATLLIVSPVLHPWHVLWLIPVLAVRQMGIAWLCLPMLVTFSYLTHLRGPLEADLTFLGDEFSFRMFEYGVFAVLILIDVFYRRTIFPRLDEGEPIRAREGTEEELAFDDFSREPEIVTY